MAGIHHGLRAQMAFWLALALFLPDTGVSLAGNLTVNNDDNLLWTDHPIHIDRSRQHFERLPSSIVVEPLQSGLDVPNFIKVVDSATFIFGGKTYRLRHIEPIRQGRICRGADGHRWTCGLMSAIFIGRLVRGRRLFCDKPTTEGPMVMIDCRIANTTRLADAVISQGFGLALSDPTLVSLQAIAIKAHAGIWQNEACIANFRSC